VSEDNNCALLSPVHNQHGNDEYYRVEQSDETIDHPLEDEDSNIALSMLSIKSKEQNSPHPPTTGSPNTDKGRHTPTDGSSSLVYYLGNTHEWVGKCMDGGNSLNQWIDACYSILE